MVYLALSGGGYDIIARSEVGIALWWIVLLGVIVGVLPRVRYSLSAWIGLLLFAAFLAWTVSATDWSQSEERTLAEAARVATYLGVFVLGLSLMTRSAVRSLLGGLAVAITLVSGLAVLSRLVPGWFPVDSARRFYATARLSYPFDYADGVGEFAALGIPLLLFVASSARTLIGRALGAAGLPVVVLCLALTVSRGGILAAVAGLVVFFALSPDRLPRLAAAAAAAAASAVVLVALAQRAGVRDSFKTAAPAGQRHTMLLVLVLACAGVALAQLGITLAVRFGARPRWLAVSRRRASALGALLLAAVLIGLVVVIASGSDHRLWQQFKEVNPQSGGSQYSRLLSVAGSHRYQYWQAAVAAFHTSPWKGIGPGTFEFYWAQHNSLAEFVRNAHSLYIETLAELGIIGLALIGGFFAFVLGAGSIRAMRAPVQDRAVTATAVAGVAAFCAAAAFDWVWQIGAIPLIGLLLAAAALTGLRERDQIGAERRLLDRRVTRATLAVGTILALWAIVVPLSTAIAVRSSQAEAAKGNLRAALVDAATAQRLESSAASPRLERALILEQLGEVAGASQSIAQALGREPNNWRLWLVASRIATESNRPSVALADYRRARMLNPSSPIFLK
ncbi:MAG: O-antigen ligase family protein [Solirubrobacteraceae bacterium]